MYVHLRLNEKSIEIPTASLEFERLWFATQQVMHLSDISYEEDGIQLADAPVQEGQYPKRDRPRFGTLEVSSEFSMVSGGTW